MMKKNVCKRKNGKKESKYYSGCVWISTPNRKRNKRWLCGKDLSLSRTIWLSVGAANFAFAFGPFSYKHLISILIELKGHSY